MNVRDAFLIARSRRRKRERVAESFEVDFDDLFSKRSRSSSGLMVT